MHSYLQAIGFSNITKDELDHLIYEAIRKPDSHEVALDSDGNEFVELDFEVCEHTGIAIRSVYDTDDNYIIYGVSNYLKGNLQLSYLKEGESILVISNGKVLLSDPYQFDKIYSIQLLQ